MDIEMDNFSIPSALLQSAITTSFIAVGPVGLSIRVSQSIGSSSSKLVFVALVQIRVMEIIG
jgi:hypothetical protein